MNDKSGNNSYKLPRQIFNFEAFLHIVKSLQQIDPKKPTKNSCKPTDFWQSLQFTFGSVQWDEGLLCQQSGYSTINFARRATQSLVLWRHPVCKALDTLCLLITHAANSQRPMLTEHYKIKFEFSCEKSLYEFQRVVLTTSQVLRTPLFISLQPWQAYIPFQPNNWKKGPFTAKLQNLSESSWFACVFLLVLVGFVLCCLKASHH